MSRAASSPPKAVRSRMRTLAPSLRKPFFRGGQVPLPRIADLYGTSFGQVPTDYDPALASYDAEDNLISLPNQGGAGAVFDATPQGSVQRVAGSSMLSFNGDNWVSPTEPMDLVGVRAFLVVDLAFPDRLVYPMGNNDRYDDPGTNEGLTNVRFDSLNGNVLFSRNNGSSWEQMSGNAWWPDIGPGLYLIEIEVMPGGKVRMFLNGTILGEGDTPAGWANFYVSRIGRGQAGPGISGSMGRVVALITDGTSAYDAQVETIRRELNEAYGIGAA